MDKTLHYFKVALRQMGKYRVQTAISVAGLAICLLCFSLCMYISRYLMSTDGCFPHKERIARIGTLMENGREYYGTTRLLTRQLRSQSWDGVETFTWVGSSLPYDYLVETRPDEMTPYGKLYTLQTDSSLYRLFPSRIVAGSWEAAAHTPDALVVSASTARRLFGGSPADAIGRRMQPLRATSFSEHQEGKTHVFTVRAVMEDWPDNTTIGGMRHIDLLMLNDSGAGAYEEEENWFGTNYVLLGEEGATVAGLQEQMRRTGFRYRGKYADADVCVSALGDEPFRRGTSMSYNLWSMLATGLLVLVVGLVNFFAFLTGTYLNRVRECSLRRVLGGGTRQIATQLSVQAGLMVGAAFLITCCLIELSAPLLTVRLSGMDIHVDPARLYVHCLQYFPAVLALSLVPGWLMALRTRHTAVQTGLRGLWGGRGRRRMRLAMLGVQFVVCWIFVTLAASIHMQTRATSASIYPTLSREEKRDILKVQLEYSVLKQTDRQALLDQMKQLAGVADCLPMDLVYSEHGSPAYVQVDSMNIYAISHDYSVCLRRVPRNYMSFLNIPVEQTHTSGRGAELVADRALDNLHRQRKGTTLAGHTVWEHMNIPEGLAVSGVCPTQNYETYAGFGLDYDGDLYLLTDSPRNISHCYLKCVHGQTAGVARQVRHLMEAALPPTMAPEVTTLQADLEAHLSIERRLRDIILFFAAVCLTLTMLGVYAAVTLDCERRRKEVAIRKVNGARVGDILRLFGCTDLRMLALTALVAFPALYTFLKTWSERYVAAYGYGLLFWAGIWLGVAGITTLTVLWHILKTARANPADEVKNE